MLLAWARLSQIGSGAISVWAKQPEGATNPVVFLHEKGSDSKSN